MVFLWPLMMFIWEETIRISEIIYCSDKKSSQNYSFVVAKQENSHMNYGRSCASKAN